MRTHLSKRSPTQGLRLLAHHQGAQLVQTLVAWRQGAGDEIRRAYGGGAPGTPGSGGAPGTPGGGGAGAGGGTGGGQLSLTGLCKRAAAELVFLDAADVVLAAARPPFADSPQFGAFFEHVLQ